MWAYLAACGAMGFAFTSIVLLISLIGEQRKRQSLEKLNTSLSVQLKTQAECLNELNKQVTKSRRIETENATVPLLRNILEKGITAHLSHDGPTFQIKVNLNAHYYEEVDLSKIALPSCPQVFLHRDIQKLVTRWAETAKPQITNELYRQMCESLNLVPVEPVFFASLATDASASNQESVVHESVRR